MALLVADAVQFARRVSAMEEHLAAELAAKMMSKERIQKIKLIRKLTHVFNTLKSDRARRVCQNFLKRL